MAGFPDTDRPGAAARLWMELDLTIQSLIGEGPDRVRAKGWVTISTLNGPENPVVTRASFRGIWLLDPRERFPDNDLCPAA